MNTAALLALDALSTESPLCALSDRWDLIFECMHCAGGDEEQQGILGSEVDNLMEAEALVKLMLGQIAKIVRDSDELLYVGVKVCTGETVGVICQAEAIFLLRRGESLQGKMNFAQLMKLVVRVEW